MEAHDVLRQGVAPGLRGDDQPLPTIRDAASLLSETLHKLGEGIDALRGRLDPVLRPLPPLDMVKSATAPSEHRVRDHLDNATLQTLSLIDEVNRILERLEV
jgi:hypothetical protein